MPAEFTLAVVQHQDLGSSESNLAYIETQVRRSVAAGAELILLQELHNGPYFCQTETPDRFDLAEPVPGPTSERLGALSRETGAVIVASLFERRTSGVFHNTAVVLDADGTVAGTYRKMHVPEDPGFHEKFYFTPGDLGFRPVETRLGKLGVLVCWDQWFPEAARLMTLAGAEILVVPTAIGWDPGDSDEEKQRQLEAWRLVQRGHAVANGVYLAACNRTGYEAAPKAGGDGIAFWGESFVCGPQGEIIARAGPDPETLIAVIDRGRVERVRRGWPFLRDRRIDAYGELMRRFID